MNTDTCTSKRKLSTRSFENRPFSALTLSWVVEQSSTRKVSLEGCARTSMLTVCRPSERVWVICKNACFSERNLGEADIAYTFRFPHPINFTRYQYTRHLIHLHAMNSMERWTGIGDGCKSPYVRLTEHNIWFPRMT